MAINFLAAKWRMLALGALVTLGPVVGRADQVRFSKTLTPAEQSITGVNRLSSDQVAVLDALIRRDEKALPPLSATQTLPAQFVQRLSPEERHNAGLDLLTPGELSRLNALVARYESAWKPDRLPRAEAAIDPQFATRRPEVHGMITLTYGIGSNGYQAIGGSVVASVDDPVHGEFLTVGYAESRVRGRSIRPWCGWAPLTADPWGQPFTTFGP